MSIQEENLKAIADAIREKRGTSDPIPAKDFAQQISLIQTGSDFYIPLTVTGDEGTIVTAINGDDTVSGVTGADRTAVLILEKPGTWSVVGQLGTAMRGPETIEVISGYNVGFSFKEARLPEGYTELEYISNPNLTYLKTGLSLTSPFKRYRLEINLKLNDLSKSGGIYGSRWRQVGKNVTTDYPAFIYYSSEEQQMYVSKMSSDDYISVDDSFLRIICDGSTNTFQINDTIRSDISYPSFTSGSGGATLYGYWYNSYQYSYSSTAQWKYYNTSSIDFNLYSFKAYDYGSSETGDLLLDWVPCINPDGVVGVYDLVSETFITTIDAGKVFVAGPPV